MIISHPKVNLKIEMVDSPRLNFFQISRSFIGKRRKRA
jgi:hypothetical protein